MDGRTCWHMLIYGSIFVTIVVKESQIFYNILYRCLERIIFLFKIPASPNPPDWLIIRQWDFLSGIFVNLRMVFWNSWIQKDFHETNQSASVNEFSTINGWTIFFVLIRIYFPWAAALISWHRGLRVLGTIVGNSKLVQSESREKNIPALFFRSTPEIIM